MKDDIDFSADCNGFELFQSDDSMFDTLFDLDFDFPEMTPNADVQSISMNSESDASQNGSRKRPAKSTKTKAVLGEVTTTQNRTNAKKRKLPSPAGSCRNIEELQIEYFTRPLVVFPSFDRSDALIYLPNTLTRFLNEGDMLSMSKLLLSHLDKNCVIDMSLSSPRVLTTRLFIELLELVSDFHPDSVMCTHSTKVVENQICASIYGKFTDSRFIRNSVIKRIKNDSLLSSMFSLPREDRLRHTLREEGDRSEEERKTFLALADSEDDLLIYVKAEIVMTIDDLTKKVSKFRIRARTTSMHPIVPVCSE